MTSRTLLAVTVLFSVSVAAAPCPTRASWPTESWPKGGTNNKTAELKAMEDYAFTTFGTDRQRYGVRTDGLMIIKGGNIIYERYARGWSASNRHLSWSVAKSISSAMIGVAVNKGLMNIEDSICTYLTEYAGKPICSIKVKHFLTFGSGVQWQEGYEDGSYQSSSVISMLLGEGHRDQIGFVLDQHQLRAPGTQFVYSTGDAAVVAALAKAALKPAYGNDAFWSQLFDKIGMHRAVFEEDPKGNPLGGSYVYATLRDYARFGYLFLNDGCWNGERLLPEGWVRSSSTISDTFKSNRGYCSEEDPPAGTVALPCARVPSGYMWWLNQAPIAEGKKPYKDLPDDTYFANGHWGQYIAVFPSADVVVVRIGDDRNYCPDNAVDGKVDGVNCDFSFNKLMSLALEVAK